MRNILRFIAYYLASSAIATLCWLILSYPDLPSSPGQWALLFAIALPIQVAAEFIGRIFTENKVARYVERKTEAQPLSLLRITFFLIVSLLFIAIMSGAAHLWGTLTA